MPGFANRPKQIAEGLHRRQYRGHRLDRVQANNIRFSTEVE